jgi:hypothetical protein
MLLYHYSIEQYPDLRTKEAQGVLSPTEMLKMDMIAKFRCQVSPSYASISLLPDPIPLDIMGALYAGRNHFIWRAGFAIYEHVVESSAFPKFKYHISETPGDIRQMLEGWGDNPTDAEKREYFKSKTMRKTRVGENGEGNVDLERHFGQYVHQTRKAYLAAVQLFDEGNWRQYAPMVPHVQIDPVGGILKLAQPPKRVIIGPESAPIPVMSLQVAKRYLTRQTK